MVINRSAADLTPPKDIPRGSYNPESTMNDRKASRRSEVVAFRPKDL